jgi:heme-degrading monooxygenase HmoA
LTVTPVIRILRFRPLRVGFDGVLRDHEIPNLRRAPGLIDIVAGRHGPDELGPRIVASVWASVEAMTAADGLPAATARPDRVPDTADTELEILSVKVAVRADSGDVPRVLRTFRGQVRPGELPAYIEEARSGTLLDNEAGHGPLALYLATVDSSPDRFVTLSTWRDWSAIQAATGGDIRQPVATRHAERIVASEATHYEAIEI